MEDGLILPGATLDQGWGWLADEMSAQEKSASRGRPERGGTRGRLPDSPSRSFRSGPSDDLFGAGGSGSLLQE